MSQPKYEKLIEDVPADNKNPPKPDKELDLPKSPGGPPSTMSYGVPPSESPNYNPPEAESCQYSGPPSPRTIVITQAEDIEEPDFMGYSYCATLFCCCFLGRIAFFFSKRARQANEIGDKKAAQRNSKIAFALIIMSFVLGVVCWIAYLVFRTKY